MKELTIALLLMIAIVNVFFVVFLEKRVSALEEWRCVSSIVSEYGLETCVQFVRVKTTTLTGKELQSFAEQN